MMKKFLIINLLVTHLIYAMENTTSAERQNKEQVDWAQLPQEIWIEILKFVIGGGQGHKERLNSYSKLARCNKKFNKWVELSVLQNLLTKFSEDEVKRIVLENNRKREIELGEPVSQTDYDVERTFTKGFITSMALTFGQFDYIYLYLKNSPEKINEPLDDSLTTLLHRSVGNSNRVFKYLIDRNCAINPRNIDGNTPLHFASDARLSENIAEQIKILVEKGADPYIKNSKGKSPLYMFADDQEWDLVNLIVPKEHKLAVGFLQKADGIEKITDGIQVVAIQTKFEKPEHAYKAATR